MISGAARHFDRAASGAEDDVDQRGDGEIHLQLRLGIKYCVESDGRYTPIMPWKLKIMAQDVFCERRIPQ